jgi:hypothetical protein
MDIRRLFMRKKERNRQVFGFLCDRDLIRRVRMVARILEAPIYCVSEHLLLTGLTHIGFEITGNAENLEPAIQELRGHLVRCHLLAERLDDEECGSRLTDKHAELPPGQEEVNAIIGLVNDFRDQGVPHDVVMEAVRGSVAQLRMQRMIQRIRRERDFKMLIEIDRRFPRLIPVLLSLAHEYSAEDLLDALST